MARSAALLLLALLVLPNALAYPDPDDAPRHYDSPCIERFDRRFVYDFVGAFAQRHAVEIEGAACEVYAKTHAHVVVAAVQDTEGEPLESYALHLFERWGIGRGEVHDGLLFLYVRDYNMSGARSALRVEVGYGLEHVVNARVALAAISLARDAKESALEAGEPMDEAVSFGLASGVAYLLTTLDAQYVDGAFPAPQAPPVPWEAWLTTALVLTAIVLILYNGATRPRRGWGYYPGSPHWGGGGLGGYFGGGSFGGGGGFGGGGFGGGRSGGGGGSGGF